MTAPTLTPASCSVQLESLLAERGQITRPDLVDYLADLTGYTPDHVRDVILELVAAGRADLLLPAPADRTDGMTLSRPDLVDA